MSLRHESVKKTSNVVKLIDFGTAAVFHYPGKKLTKASGVVGSDPYLTRPTIRGRPMCGAWPSSSCA